MKARRRQRMGQDSKLDYAIRLQMCVQSTRWQEVVRNTWLPELGPTKLVYGCNCWRSPQCGHSLSLPNGHMCLAPLGMISRQPSFSKSLCWGITTHCLLSPETFPRMANYRHRPTDWMICDSHSRTCGRTLIGNQSRMTCEAHNAVFVSILLGIQDAEPYPKCLRNKQALTCTERDKRFPNCPTVWQVRPCGQNF